jgi:hypothetical protein
MRLESDDGIFSNCTSLEQVSFRGKLKDYTWHDAQAPELLRGCDREKTFKGCIRLRRIVAREIPLSMIPQAWKAWAVNGFIADIERNVHYSPEIAEEYHEYLRVNYQQLLNRTLSDHGYPLYHYLMEQRMITLDNFDTLLQRARDANSTEVIAALLAYQHTEWGQIRFEQRIEKALLDLDT